MMLMRLAFSLLWGAVGLYLVKKIRDVFVARRNIVENGVVTEGEIVAFEVSRSSSDKLQEKYLAPVVTFNGPAGESRRFTSGRARRPNPYVVGQRLAVRYLKDDPTVVDLDGAATSWLPIILLLVFATVSLTVATLPFLLAPRG